MPRPNRTSGSLWWTTVPRRSLEQARSYCSRENFTLIENGTNTGFSHAVNQGIALADSEYVVLFNNDAFAEPQWWKS